MMSFSSDMIIMIDQDGRIVQVNNPFLQFTGLSPESLIGQHFTHDDIIILRELPVQELLTGSS